MWRDGHRRRPWDDGRQRQGRDGRRERHRRGENRGDDLRYGRHDLPDDGLGVRDRRARGTGLRDDHSCRLLHDRLRDRVRDDRRRLRDGGDRLRHSPVVARASDANGDVRIFWLILRRRALILAATRWGIRRIAVEVPVPRPCSVRDSVLFRRSVRRVAVPVPVPDPRGRKRTHRRILAGHICSRGRLRGRARRRVGRRRRYYVRNARKRRFRRTRTVGRRRVILRLRFLILAFRGRLRCFRLWRRCFWSGCRRRRDGGDGGDFDRGGGRCLGHRDSGRRKVVDGGRNVRCRCRQRDLFRVAGGSRREIESGRGRKRLPDLALHVLQIPEANAIEP